MKVYLILANVTKYISNRCIAYETNYTDNNNSVVHHLCDLSNERCIPDNIDCVFNVPIKYVNGKPHCDAGPDNKQKCKCQYPIGWCIPLEAGNNIITKMATQFKAFVDPYFYNTKMIPA